MVIILLAEKAALPLWIIKETKPFHCLIHGLIDDQANIVLENQFDNLLTKDFADAAFSTAKEVKVFCDAILYPELRAINNKEISHSYDIKDGRNPNAAIVDLPQYVFIKRKNRIGIFNMATLKIEIPCKYESIYKNNKGQVFGYFKAEKEELLILK